MENASKALLIAGAILLSILIIAIGMSIYTSASSTVSESVTSMSTQEKNAFNMQFTYYENAQTGAKVKALIGVLISNSNTYQDEVAKIPTLTVVDYATVKGNNANKAMNAVRPDKPGSTNDYVQNLGVIRNEIEDKHTYWVEMVYGAGGIIDEIRIHYNSTKL